MRNIHLFSLSVVMLLRIRGSETRRHWRCALVGCIRNNVKVGVIPFEELEKREFKFSKQNYVPTECGTHEPRAWHESVVDRAHELKRPDATTIYVSRPGSIIAADVIEHDGGWGYTDKDVCQKERCDPWYGVFKERGSADEYQPATTAKIIGFKCFCTPSEELKKTIKRVYKGKFKAYAFRGLHFLGFGRKIRGWYPKIQFLGGYGNGGYSKVDIHHHAH